MKTLNSPRPWPPEACDELGRHLSRYGWAHEPKPAVDDLFAIFDELHGWLKDARDYHEQNRRPEWSSITADVRAALDLAGSRLTPHVPSLAALVDGLDAQLGVDEVRRAELIPVLDQVLAELRAPAVPGAAFLDLVEAVEDPVTRIAVIGGRVDLLDAVLRFAGRSLGGMSSILSGILDNDGSCVHHALHQLDGIQIRPLQELDADAGLAEGPRIDLARRWVEHQPAPAHHVVWLFYGNARAPRADWRFAVGGCEFFGGPALLSALNEVDAVRDAGGTYPGDQHAYSTPPAELIVDDSSGKFLREEHGWPEEEDWVGVRVDLGTATYPDVVRTARDQARVLIALAAFDLGQTSWTELTGHKHFIDGHEADSSMPFEALHEERKWADADHTGNWLHEHQAELGHRLAAGPEAHAVVTAATALANTRSATPAISLLEAVRVIEAQASVLNVHWKALVKEYAIPAAALFRAQISASTAIEAVSRDRGLVRHLPHLQGLPSEFTRYEDDRRVIDMPSAVKRLPALIAEVPTYNLHSRRLRQAAKDLATPATIAAVVAQETAREQRLLSRVHRVRNALTHGGPVNATIVASANTFITGKAQHITGVAVRALLDGQSPTEALLDYRSSNAAWTAGLADQSTALAALFPSMADDD